MINLLKSWKFWLIFGVGVAVISSLTVFVFHIVNINAKLDAPLNLEVVQLSNGTTYLQVDESAGAVTYEYVITVGETSNTITDASNAIDVTALLQKPEHYEIKCRVIGQTTSSTSDYGETITFWMTHKIQTVSVWLGEGENASNLYFSVSDSFLENVALSFELFYSANGDDTFQNMTADPETDNLNGVATGHFNLSSLASGEYSISVRALAEDADYLASSLSDQIIYIAV